MFYEIIHWNDAVCFFLKFEIVIVVDAFQSGSRTFFGNGIDNIHNLFYFIAHAERPRFGVILEMSHWRDRDHEIFEPHLLYGRDHLIGIVQGYVSMARTDRLLKPQLPPMLLQPPLFLLIIRHGVCHQFPETGRVVQLDEVGQFVDDHVVDDLIRGEEQAGGQVDVFLGRATPPVGEVVFEADGLNGLLKMFVVEVVDAAGDLRQEILGDDAAQQVLEVAVQAFAPVVLAEVQADGFVFSELPAVRLPVLVLNAQAVTALADL